MVANTEIVLQFTATLVLEQFRNQKLSHNIEFPKF